MSKLNKAKKREDLHKRLNSNFLAIGGLLAIDFLTVMLQSSAKVSENQGDLVAQQVLYFAIISYVIVFSLGYFCFKLIQKGEKEKLKRRMMGIILLTVLNMVTFVFGGYAASFVILGMAIVAMIYSREVVKREM